MSPKALLILGVVDGIVKALEFAQKLTAQARESGEISEAEAARIVAAARRSDSAWDGIVRSQQ